MKGDLGSPKAKGYSFGTSQRFVTHQASSRGLVTAVHKHELTNYFLQTYKKLCKAKSRDQVRHWGSSFAHSSSSALTMRARPHTSYPLYHACHPSHKLSYIPCLPHLTQAALYTKVRNAMHGFARHRNKIRRQVRAVGFTAGA